LKNPKKFLLKLTKSVKKFWKVWFSQFENLMMITSSKSSLIWYIMNW
jgi:hypothetical protein